MRLTNRDKNLLAEAYRVIYLKEQINDDLLNYLEQRSDQVKHYKKFAKVKAYQSKGNEQIQTTLTTKNKDGEFVDFDETSKRTTNSGDWVVTNIGNQNEQQIVDDKTFRKRYDVDNPKGDIYSPKGANFFGVVYDGSLGDSITFAPPNWGGSTMNITKGYMIGGPDPENFAADFYGIDPDAFKATYKPAEMVTERFNPFSRFKKKQPDQSQQPNSAREAYERRQSGGSVSIKLGDGNIHKFYTKQLIFEASKDIVKSVKTGRGVTEKKIGIYKTFYSDDPSGYGRDVDAFIPVVWYYDEDAEYPHLPEAFVDAGKQSYNTREEAVRAGIEMLYDKI